MPIKENIFGSPKERIVLFVPLWISENSLETHVSGGKGAVSMANFVERLRTAVLITWQ